MRAATRKWHRYIALYSSWLVILSSLSGTILLLKHPIISLMVCSGARFEKTGDVDYYGKGLDHIHTHWGGEKIKYLKVPNQEETYWSLWLESGERILLDIDQLKPITKNLAVVDWMDFVFQLHADLFSGITGQVVLLVFTLSLFYLFFSGLFLWWPSRKTLSLDTRKKSPLVKHRNLGVFAFSGLLVVSLTGGVMLTKKVARKAFSSPRAIPTQAVSPQLIDTSPILQPSRILEVAVGQIPLSIPSYVWLPKPEKKKAKFRLRLDGEWHLNGKTNATVDARTGTLLELQRSDQVAISQKLLNLMWPIHSGRGLPVYYSTILFLVGIALLRILYTGLLSWKKRKKGKKINRVGIVVGKKTNP